jgi:glutaredoxin
MKRLVLAAVILGCVAGTASAQLYKWIDEQGRTRYTDTPPPPNAKGAQKKNYNSGASEAAVPYATQRAMREFPVVLYTAPNCGKACADGKALLERRGVPHREIVARDAGDIEAMKSATGQDQVPALLVGSEAIGGFGAARWDAALNLAGYPTSAVKPQAARAPADGPLPSVKLYTNSECNEVCDAARGYLAGRNVRFQEVRVEDEASLAELKKVSGGLSVPVLIVGNTVQKGYEQVTYQRLLDAAGFPKTK